LGKQIHPSFLNALRKASGRQEWTRWANLHVRLD
jgi:hypothetical protein